MPLNSKQRMFVLEYLVDRNATRAAVAAGYSEKTAHVAGCRLLKDVNVAAQIDSETQKRSDKLGITADYVLGGIQQTIERCSQAEAVRDREGNETGEYRFDAFAVLKGYELLGKHLKLFTDKKQLEHTGEDGGSIKADIMVRFVDSEV